MTVCKICHKRFDPLGFCSHRASHWNPYEGKRGQGKIFRKYIGYFDPDRTYDILVNAFAIGYEDADPRTDLIKIKGVKFQADGVWTAADGRRGPDQVIEFIKERS